MQTNVRSNSSARFLFVLVIMLASGALTVAQSTGHRNGKIAFSSDREGGQKIYVMNSDGTNQVQITDGPGADDQPTWSPDGTRIAFVGLKASGGSAIFVINSDGTDRKELTPVTPPAYFNPNLSWSPDGRSIAITDSDRIYIVDANNGNKRFLTSGVEPSWSPDGSKILFIEGSSGPHELVTIRPDGTGVRFLLGNLPGFYGITDYPAWAPDGSRIAFLAFDGANEGIFIANSDGTDAHAFAFDCGGPSAQGCSYISSLAWSPDGSRMVYGAYGAIYVIDKDGNGRDALATTGYNSSPSWQPLVDVSISGRVTTPDGRGLRNAMVTLTDSEGMRRTVVTSSFGFYQFESIQAGTYVISASSRRYRFEPRSLLISENLTGVDLTGAE